MQGVTRKTSKKALIQRARNLVHVRSERTEKRNHQVSL